MRRFGVIFFSGFSAFRLCFNVHINVATTAVHCTQTDLIASILLFSTCGRCTLQCKYTMQDSAISRGGVLLLPRQIPLFLSLNSDIWEGFMDFVDYIFPSVRQIISESCVLTHD